MTSVQELVRPGILAASPDESVHRAALRMETLHAGCLPVLDRDDRLVGLLTLWNVHRAHPNRLVADAMTREFVRVDAAASLWEAHQLAESAAVEHIPVLDGGRLVGMVTRTELAIAVARFTDALTGLPTSAYVRHQIRAMLQSGQATSLIFVDINDFGSFNKQRGHASGDRVLSLITSVVRQISEPERDFPCRYGGDEFAIVTSRPVGEARELANRLIQHIYGATQREGMSVTVSAGVAGGRRRGVRAIESDQITNLINLASMASTEAKRADGGVLVLELAAGLG